MASALGKKARNVKFGVLHAGLDQSIYDISLDASLVISVLGTDVGLNRLSTLRLGSEGNLVSGGEVTGVFELLCFLTSLNIS